MDLKTKRESQRHNLCICLHSRQNLTQDVTGKERTKEIIYNIKKTKEKKNV